MNQLLAAAALVLTLPAAAQRSPQPGLRVIVIQGEDAVNILQQKTAVAPIVEVRDQNDLPVGGAIVTFSVSGGQAAFAGGAQQITVTTNAAGRAAASALNPLQAGPVRIQVQAAFQGQTATTTIAQTNAATAAEAAARAAEKVQGGQGASGGATTGATTAGAAGASGGGLSGAAIAGIVGGVAAGAGLGLKAAGGGGADDNGGSGGGGGGGGSSTPCRFTLSQTSVSTNSQPSSTTILVTAEPANCSTPSWTATASSASNFFLLSNNSAVQTGSGSGSSFSVNIPENRSGGPRTGTVTFAPAGLTVAVTQAANCLFTVSPTSFGVIQAIGGTDQVAVMLANSPCDPANWTAVVNTTGAVTISPTSGSSSGLINVTFLPQGPNTSGSRPVSITVAGQVISGTQLATTPTAACQAQAMRGSDVGEARRIDFGQTSGTFLLTYDTGDRSADRVVVLYEGRQLFDSGCVSTSGPQTRALNYSGNSSAVTVQVSPNCRGGFGSSWSIELACSR